MMQYIGTFNSYDILKTLQILRKCGIHAHAHDKIEAYDKT